MNCHFSPIYSCIVLHDLLHIISDNGGRCVAGGVSVGRREDVGGEGGGGKN